MKNNIVKIIFVIVVICLIVAGINILKKRKMAIVNEPVAIPLTHTVKIILPQEKSISPAISFLAKLEAKKTASLASKLSGRITAVLVHEGQKVKKGDLIIKIDDKEIRSTLASLQAQLDSAKEQYDFNNSKYQRNVVLFKAGGVAEEKLDGSKADLASAVAKVKDLQNGIAGLKNQLDYLRIEAPFAGIVGTIFQHQGDLAAPARTILTINSLPQKLTFSFMPGSAEIIPGQSVLFNGRKIGRIKTIYNDAINGLTVAEVGLDKQILSPNGSYLTINVSRKAVTGCAVPVQALLHRQEANAVMVYRNEHFSEKKVNVLADDQEFALIDPCPEQPVAVAAEAKLALLPTYGHIVTKLQSPAKIISGEKHE